MLYLIGLGLNERGISKQGMLAIEKCHKLYLENYTINLRRAKHCHNWPCVFFVLQKKFELFTMLWGQQIGKIWTFKNPVISFIQVHWAE